MLAEKILLAVLVSFGLRAGCCFADTGLPLIQISHDDDLGDDYPEMREEIHLEDFFWTGSGDGPPDYLKKVHTGISKGKDVIVKTETVVATVYVDGNNEIDIPICIDCPPDDGGGGNWDVGAMPPLNYSSTDRRYWLLTVMSGFYSQKDNPALEEKLARLYRLAFTRQQSRHLGINGAQQIAGIAVSAGRNRRGNHKNNMQPIQTTTPRDLDDEAEMLDMIGEDALTNTRPIPPKRSTNRNTEWETSSEENGDTLSITSTTDTIDYAMPTTLEISVTRDTRGMSTTEVPYMTIVPWELIQEAAKSEKLQATAALLESQAALIPLQLQNPLLRSARVHVMIHNITQITEDEVQRGLRSTAAYEEDVNEKVDERPIANQTELIYSVFVNGRPVLATTAANDMKLVSETEAADVIGQEVYMKAEPYLREPQATPLAPAIRSGQKGFLASIEHNTALVVISSVAILLLLLLVVALLLMGRSRVREKQRLEEQRTTSRNELLAELQSGRGASTDTGLNTGRSTAHSRDVGVHNFSFEHDGVHSRREARINFPGPPAEREYRHDSLSSSENTSDSSVYCPINPPAADVQRILDDKAAKVYDKQRRRQQHEYDQAEGRDNAVYTSVISEKKHDKTRRKNKRRYLSENRVGSLETSPRTHHAAQSSGDEVVSGSMDDDQLSASYARFERTEAFNPHNNYNRNKLLHQKSSRFADKEDAEQLQATEAINKEIIHALQPTTEKSSDTGSIGSFLSMASVKAFPKSSLPQPLNRVLDPVFVTYYDNVEDPTARKQQSSTTRTTRKQLSRQETFDAATIATIENFPTPKAPSQTHLGATQSDNPDPGIVGPIVWERHKKRMQEAADAAAAADDDDDKDEMLLRYNEKYGNNPGAIRNHYEDLLEGAMQMYSSQDDLPMPLPTCDFNNKRKPTKRENRGSSAGVSSFAARHNNAEPRPATAQPAQTSKSNQSTQPPSPSSDAWGGSLYGSHSPLIRPLSAGPFQRSETFQVIGPPRSASNRSDLSAEPLIEAIKSELRRYKDGQH